MISQFPRFVTLLATFDQPLYLWCAFQDRSEEEGRWFLWGSEAEEISRNRNTSICTEYWWLYACAYV